MNKLEEYREREAPLAGCDGMETPYVYRQGFDAAIALDLPVKFMDWIFGEYMLELKEKEEFKDIDDKTLYKYWIDNIYKP